MSKLAVEKIPVSVIIVTKNEAGKIARTLSFLSFTWMDAAFGWRNWAEAGSSRTTKALDKRNRIGYLRKNANAR